MSRKTDSILQSAIERSVYDPVFFMRFFLKHWFPSPLPPVHIGLLAILQKKVEFLVEYPEAHDFLLRWFRYMPDPRLGEKTATEPVFVKNSAGEIVFHATPHHNFIMPRGFSKTTLLNGDNTYSSVTDPTFFGVYLSASADHAESQLGNVKFELESNELLRAAYGNQVPNRADPERWGADQIQLLNGAILVARGRGGQIRGLNFRGRRPNKITLDDVEDEDSVATATLRKKTSSWLHSSVKFSGVQMDVQLENAQAPLRITNLGTLLGPDALCMSLAQDPEFGTIRFGAKLEDENGSEMLWPFKMSEVTYEKKRANAQINGRLAEFSREIDSKIRISDDTIFPSVFIYEPTPLSDLVHRSMALDPAISDQPGADSAALIVAGRRATDGALWMLDEWGGTGKTPREKIDMFFEKHLQWQTTHNGIEAQQYQKSLIFLMKEEMARRGYFFVITPIVQGSHITKDNRIVGILSPRYMNGYIRHLRPLPQLEGNLLDWPNGKKDFADAAAMAMTLLGQSAGLVVPEEKRALPEYEPLPEQLPPIYTTTKNYILHPGVNRRARYGVKR